MEDGLRGLLQESLEVVPSEGCGNFSTHRLCDPKNHVAGVFRVVEWFHHRPPDSQNRRFHYRGDRIILPSLQVGVVRKDQVGLRRALIHEGRKAYDKRDLLESLCEPHRFGSGIDRVGIIEEEGADRVGVPPEDALGNL